MSSIPTIKKSKKNSYPTVVFKRSGKPKNSKKNSKKSQKSSNSKHYLVKNRIMSTQLEKLNKIKGKLSRSYLKNNGDFDTYKQKIARYFIVFNDIKTGEKKVIPAIKKSRYFKQGLRNNLWKFKKKLDKKGRHEGILLTLTFAQSGFSYDYVYKELQGAIRIFMNNAKTYYKRHHLGEGFEYVWVVEFHKSGYPHVHIFFPDLHWLTHWSNILHWWKYGTIHVKYRNIGHVGSYMASYLSKKEQKVNEDGFYYMWKYGIRQYGFSRMFFEKVKKVKRYELEFSVYYSKNGNAYFICNEKKKKTQREMWKIFDSL